MIGLAKGDVFRLVLDPACEDATGWTEVTLPEGYVAENYRWNGSALVPDLGGVKARIWSAVQGKRDAAQGSGCVTPLGPVFTDPNNRVMISGAVLMAQIAIAAGQPFSVTWPMADGSAAPHDGPAMIAMGVAVGDYVAACNEHALTLRAAIDAAADLAAVLAIDTGAGWPATL